MAFSRAVTRAATPEARRLALVGVDLAQRAGDVACGRAVIEAFGGGDVRALRRAVRLAGVAWDGACAAARAQGLAADAAQAAAYRWAAHTLRAQEASPAAWEWLVGGLFAGLFLAKLLPKPRRR